MSYGPATMHSELRQKPFTNFAHVHLDLLEGGAGGRLSPDAMRSCQNFCIDTRTSIRNDLAMLQPSHASPISNCQATLLLPQNRCAGFSMMAAKPSRRGGCRLLKGELRAFFLIGPREPLLSFLATHNLSIPLTDPFPNQVLLQPHWRKEMTTRSPQPRWSREQIRAARLAPLPPLLQKRGLQLVEQDAGNFTLPSYPVLIVKAGYWRWPQRNLSGNAIDFFMRVLGLSFHDSMRQITDS